MASLFRLERAAWHIRLKRFWLLRFGPFREMWREWELYGMSVRDQVEDGWAPDANEEYLIYQTLLGAWPLEPYGPEEYAAFGQRVLAYVAKALHEAKVHTRWINPDPAYDRLHTGLAVRRT